ncbi:UNVERIFIED_ORG: hypothetical protein GGE11_004819 [Mycolicibacterium obuense]|nr:hypothetical protein [Mycolicibacterium monacense]
MSRLYDMLRHMHQVPDVPGSVPRPSLLITAGAAIVTAALFDLSQIASLGAMLYLTMDIAIHWGLIRRLKHDVDVKRWVPALAIVLDVLILGPFVIVTAREGLATLVVFGLMSAAIVLGQRAAVSHRNRTSVASEDPKDGTDVGQDRP